MRIIAKALIFDKQGNILVLRRSGSHPHFAHHFDFPGGEVEQKEDPAKAVVREIKEETGLIIKSSKLNLGFEKKLPSELTHTLFVIHLDDIRPDVIASWEHSGYEWLAADALLSQPLPSSTDPYYIDAIEWLGSRPAD